MKRLLLGLSLVIGEWSCHPGGIGTYGPLLP